MKRLTKLALLPLALALPAMAQQPYQQPDDSWISISGSVQTVSLDSFTLDYGHGIIKVEMDDGDRDADAYKLLQGDKVTVFGRIDDDFFETTTIDASSVYVESLGTYFYASAVDRDDAYLNVTTPITISDTVLTGTVTEVSGEEFVIDTGLRRVRVEVDEMAYNPLDDDGYQRIRIGDRVSVSGEMDSDFFEGRELVANSVTTLSNTR